MTAGRWAKAPAGERPNQDGAAGTMHGKSCVLRELCLRRRETRMVRRGETAIAHALSSASQLASSEVIADSTICPMHAYALFPIGSAACRIVRRVVQEASGGTKFVDGDCDRWDRDLPRPSVLKGSDSQRYCSCEKLQACPTQQGDVSSPCEHSLHAAGRAWGTLREGIPIALWANTL